MEEPIVGLNVQLPKMTVLESSQEQELSEEEMLAKRAEAIKKWEREQEDIALQKKLTHYRDTENSGVNRKYWKESLDTFKAESNEDEKNVLYIKDFCRKKTRPMLLILGKYGTGKTHIGCSIIRECGGRIITSFELCTLYEMGSDYKSDMNKMEVLKYFSELPMLVIDELGRGKPDIEKQIIPYIINARYEKELPLVMISNLEKKEVMNLLGEASVDRLKEVCSTLVFTGNSKRG